MQEWWKEHIVEVFVGVFTLLSYFGVSATDLLGVASYANYVMPFVYLGIGAVIGWRIHRYRNNRGVMAASVQSIGSKKQKERQSKEEKNRGFLASPIRNQSVSESIADTWFGV